MHYSITSRRLVLFSTIVNGGVVVVGVGVDERELLVRKPQVSTLSLDGRGEFTTPTFEFTCEITQIKSFFFESPVPT